MSDSDLVYDDLEHVVLRAQDFLCRAAFQFITDQKKYEESSTETMVALTSALLSLAARAAQTRLVTKTEFLSLAGMCFDSEEREASLPEEDEEENKTA